MSGWAYTWPSTANVHDRRTWPGGGDVTETPLRPMVRSYVGQLAEGPAAGGMVAPATAGPVCDVGADIAPEDVHPAATSARATTPARSDHRDRFTRLSSFAPAASVNGNPPGTLARVTWHPPEVAAQRLILAPAA